MIKKFILIFFICIGSIPGADLYENSFGPDKKQTLTPEDSSASFLASDTSSFYSDIGQTDSIQSFHDSSANDTAKNYFMRQTAALGTSVFKYVLSPLRLLASSVSDSSVLYEYIAHPVLMIVTWPIEKIVTPTFGIATYPVKPPLNYMLREDVLERAINLISFGNDNQIMIYPVLVITTGTGSLTGVTFRHNSIFGRNSEKLIMQYRFFVNGNWKLRGRLKVKGIGGTRLNTQLAFIMDRMKDRGLNVPVPDSIESYSTLPPRVYYSDSSQGVSLTFSYPLREKISFLSGFRYRSYKFGKPPLGRKLAQCGSEISPFFSQSSCIEDRGLNQDFQDFIFSLGAERNTVNNPNLPTNGNYIKFDWEYHKTTKNHDFHQWDLLYKKYFFLGIERYEISPREQRKMGSLSFEKVKKVLKYNNIKKHIFNRKVIATQVKIAQSYEISKNRAPFYALNTIGNSTPMRGYLSSPFRDWTMAAVSLEYRLPIMRLVEGTIFNEYGMVEEGFKDFFTRKRLINSWGFGARLSRRDIFLFRAQLGFHGSNFFSPAINVTVDTVY